MGRGTKISQHFQVMEMKDLSTVTNDFSQVVPLHWQMNHPPVPLKPSTDGTLSPRAQLLSPDPFLVGVPTACACTSGQ